MEKAKRHKASQFTDLERLTKEADSGGNAVELIRLGQPFERAIVRRALPWGDP